MRLATSRLAPALPRALPSRRAARLASPAMTRERARPTIFARAAGGAPSDPPPPDPPRRDPPFAPSPSPTSISVDARRFRPAPLDPTAHKGRRGKVAVIGGCAEYTGAPYFAAMAALRCGADLAHVFCAEAAAPVIKSYSPELIVHPYMRETPPAREWCRDDPEDEGPEDDGPEPGPGPEGGEADASSSRSAAARRKQQSRRDALRARAADLAFADVAEWLPRMDAVVVGPGLGRDWVMLETAARVIRHVLAENAERRRKKGNDALPETTVVVDADGLHALLRHREGRCFRELETLSRRAATRAAAADDDDQDPSPTMTMSPSSSSSSDRKRRRVEIETLYVPSLALVVTPNKNERERMLDARRPRTSFDLDESDDAPPSRAPFAGEAEDQSAARYLLAFGATVVNKGARDEVRTNASSRARDAGPGPGPGPGPVDKHTKGDDDDDVIDRGSSDAAGAFGPTVLLETDVAARGAPRRCGGQGDVVSGAVAAFLAAERTRRSSGDHPGDDDGEREGDGVSPLRLRRHLAAVGGCLVTRAAARRAFERRKLATLAGDVVEELGPAMEEAWPVGGDGEGGDQATRT